MLGNIAKPQLDTPPPADQARRVMNGIKAIVRKAEPPEPGATTFRASGLHKLCPRAVFLGKEHEVLLSDDVDGSLLWIFEIGTGVHERMQNVLLPLAFPNEFQGWWRCQACNHLHVGPEVEGTYLLPPRGWIPRPEKCVVCGHGEFSYAELTFYWPEFDLSGHCDGVLVWPDAEPEVLEMKTINPNSFPYVDPFQGGKPREDHVLQDSVYQWGCGLRRGRIVYVNKGGSNLEESLAEQVIGRDDAALGTVRQRLSEAMAALNGGPCPGRLADCKMKSSRRAKQCPVRDQCFQASKS